MSHRVIRPGRDYSRQIDPHRFISRADVGGWCQVGLARLSETVVTIVGGQGIAAKLADTYWINGHAILSRWIVVQAQLGDIEHQTFTGGVRQQRLQRDGQHATGARHIRIDPGLACSSAKTNVVFFGNRFQRSAVICTT